MKSRGREVEKVRDKYIMYSLIYTLLMLLLANGRVKTEYRGDKRTLRGEK